MLHAVVMAGGSGTRFWPLSRERRPKQLLALATSRPLIVETVARLDGLVPAARIHVITNAEYAGEVRAALPDVPAPQVVPEPIGRDTAACIGLACRLIAADDSDATVVVMPADHVMHPADAFRAALAAGAEFVRERPDTLVTFGVTPSRPETGYGYIERGATTATIDGHAVHRVASFREKPGADAAREFVRSGRHSWNAGIFLFRVKAMLARLEKHQPELAAALPALAERYRATGAIDRSAYERLPKISIDYGVLEKDADVAVIEVGFQWDDVGSFAALERVLPGDASGNRVVGGATLLDAKGNVVVSSEGHHVALIGVNDLVVVHTDDATLVCRKEDAERVKEMVAKLKAERRAGLI